MPKLPLDGRILKITVLVSFTIIYKDLSGRGTLSAVQRASKLSAGTHFLHNGPKIDMPGQLSAHSASPVFWFWRPLVANKRKPSSTWKGLHAF